MNSDLNIFTHRMNLLYVLSNVNIQDSHVADIGVPRIYKTMYLLVFNLMSIAELYSGGYKYCHLIRTQVNTKNRMSTLWLKEKFARHTFCSRSYVFIQISCYNQCNQGTIR